MNMKNWYVPRKEETSIVRKEETGIVELHELQFPSLKRRFLESITLPLSLPHEFFFNALCLENFTVHEFDIFLFRGFG